MKNKLYSTLTALTLAGSSLMIIGCAAPQQGGGTVLNTVDSGLASIEQSAQTGRQAIVTGTTAATELGQSAQQMGQAISAGAAAASGMATTPGQVGLVDILVRQLGVSQQQALGGTGAIFQLAQSGMTPQAFSTLSQSVPGMTEMLNAAPVVSNPLMGGSVSGLLLGNTGAGAALNNAAALAASFQQLNLSPDMIGRFVPIVTDYVRTTSGQLTADLLNSALNVP